MRKLIIAALPLAVLAGPALAEPSCKTGGALPMWQVAKTFEDAGGTIQQMKVNDGCYEIYGHQSDARVEAFYDPKTGAEIGRE
jgi:hypothetical protein